MSELALVPSEMQAAAAAAESAAGRARDSDGADALATLTGALPGTTTAGTVYKLGDAWADGVSGWADEVTEFGASVDALTAEAEAADANAAGRFGGPR